MNRDEILQWLKSENPTPLYAEADRVRKEQVGDEIHFRGIIEFSNHCSRDCEYCGISIWNKNTPRYRMPISEVVELSLRIDEVGVRTVVLQSGEDPRFSTPQLLEVIHGIRKRSDMAITLSAGELPNEELAALKEAGADRYLIRFETASAELYHRLHPHSTLENRLAAVERVRDAGFQVGTGFLIGLPGQSLEMLADDILLTSKLEPDMIGVGPFIAHPDTPLKNAEHGELQLALKTVALLRITNPLSHLPGTTALDALSKDGREQALCSGANAMMPNFTPVGYREHYNLYPGKPRVDGDPEELLVKMRQRVEFLGRPIGKGRGDAARVSQKG